MFSSRQLFIVMNLLLTLLSAAAGAAHITDKLVVGIYADPGVDGSPLKLLSSGTPLEVLQRKDEFVEIRLADDVRGWVEARYVTDEKPAKAMLLETQTRLRALNSELEALRSSVSAEGVASPASAANPAPSVREAQLRQALGVAESRILELEQQLQEQPLAAAAQQKLIELQGQVNVALKVLADAQGMVLSQIETDGEQGFLDRYLVWIIGLGAAVLGFGMGVALIDYRIRKRYGGFRI
jgi:SH3 domain protein